MKTEGHFASKDGTSLFYRASHIASDAWVLITHGFAEHSGRYIHVMDALAKGGYSSVAFDLRGHGYSKGKKRGYIDYFGQYVEDIHAAIQFIQKEYQPKQLFLLGHSAGGLATTLYATEYAKNLDGLILSCPLFAVKVAVPAWKVLIGRLMSQYWPTLTMATEVDPSCISRDKKVVKAYQEDPLVFHTVTTRWFIEILETCARIDSAAAKVKIPLLLQLGNEDRIVDFEKAYHWFDKCASKDKTRLIYDGFYHEIYNEVEQARPLNDLVSWLKNHQGGKV